MVTAIPPADPFGGPTTLTTPLGLPAVAAAAALLEHTVSGPFEAPADPELAGRVADGLQQLAALVTAHPELAPRLHWQLRELAAPVGAQQVSAILQTAAAHGAAVHPAGVGAAGDFDRNVVRWGGDAVGLLVAAPMLPAVADAAELLVTAPAPTAAVEEVQQ